MQRPKILQATLALSLMLVIIPGFYACMGILCGVIIWGGYWVLSYFGDELPHSWEAGLTMTGICTIAFCVRGVVFVLGRWWHSK
jgi:hypothetical protein